jgi:hypothetical protein
MGTTLTGKKIKDTYKALIKVTDNSEAGSSGKQLSDGDGNDFGLYIDTDGTLGIGGAATYVLDIGSSTDALRLPKGTTVQKPTGAAGIIRYNTSTSKLELYDSDYRNIATESYVTTAINNVLDSAPDALDTLNEIAAALNDDPNFHTTITNLINGKEATITGAATTITSSDLTADRAVISNGSGKVAVSDVTSTELGYLDGVTSNVQTQISGKQDALTTGSGIDITNNVITADLDGLVDGDAIQNNVVTAPKLAEFADDLSADTAGEILVSDGSVFTNVGMSGDAQISSSGEVTIQPNAVEASMIVDNVQLEGTESVGIPAGTTAQRPSGTAGQFRYNTTTGKFEGYTTEWGEIAGGGGDAGTLEIEQDTFTGDNSDTTFDTTSTIDSVDNIQVYIDGVYQSKDNFSTSGSTITFTTAPPDGAAIEVIHFKSVVGRVQVDTFTGDNSDTTFDLTTSISSENNTQVFIDGVYQSKDNYSTSGSTITFTTAPPDGAAIEVVHVIPNSSGSGSGVTWDSTVKTAAFTAVAGEGYFVDTSSSAITVTLPSSPSVGDEVTIVDYAANAGTNNITITSSDDIEDSSLDKKINYDKGAVSLVFSGSTKGWLVASAANETDNALTTPPFDVDYLIVGAGGAGGGNWRGGGGGAGAVRTSYATQGGGTAEASAISLSAGVDYTITVGTGGSGSADADGASGGSSSISGSGITTITADGGGGGAGGYNTNDAPTYTGNGSGGGGNGYNNAGDSTGSSGGTYGNDGGDGAGSSTQCGGGGGGAGAAGVDGGGSGTAGDGGNGIIVNILNSTNAGTASVGDVQSTNVYYGGGGSGGSYDGGNDATAGLGGGGDGGYGSTSANVDDAENGSPNTGGGGGGSGEESTFGTGAGGNGGSGVVILRYPSSYTITKGSNLTEASGSPFTEGSDKVSVFTGGSDTISFS